MSKGKQVKARRTQQGLDTKTAAMLCDVSIVTLSKIENAAKGCTNGLDTQSKVCSRYQDKHRIMGG